MYIQSSHNSQVTSDQLKDVVTNALNIGISTMAKATGLPSSDLSTWHYTAGILSFSRENTISVNPDTLTVSLSGNTSIGTVYAVLYAADRKAVEIVQYPASDTVEVGFTDDTEGSYAKILWWQKDMQPMCAAERVDIASGNQ